ncbi:unnamed protein product [Agarophyton chilense]
MTVPIPSEFVSQSFRRVPNSPALPLEAVSIPQIVQAEVHSLIKQHRLSARHIRKHVKALSLARAPDFFRRRKSVAQKGQPHVEPPLKYTDAEAVSYTALRMPATLAANIFVMAELRRRLPNFAPANVLDFGAGVGVSVMAATRSFPSVKPDQPASSILDACVIDQSSPMLKLGEKLLGVDPNVSSTNVQYVTSTNEQSLRGKVYDIVCASYSLNEIVRDAMANPHDSKQQANELEEENGSVCRENRIKIAEKLLRRTIKSLWSRTKIGGLLVIIEDGTAAGFETISFARDTILNLNAAQRNQENDSDKSVTTDEEHIVAGKVIAPCLHSKICPLKDSITRHRICRFQQRLNRPLFSRNADPLPTGYEDEFFSFIAIQKIAQNSSCSSEDEDQNAGWGRLIRAPLMKRKHIAIDVCTRDGNLERRVVSKKNARPGHFSKARKSKWGDVWPEEPRSKPQTLNF